MIKEQVATSVVSTPKACIPSTVTLAGLSTRSIGLPTRGTRASGRIDSRRGGSATRVRSYFFITLVLTGATLTIAQTSIFIRDHGTTIDDHQPHPPHNHTPLPLGFIPKHDPTHVRQQAPTQALVRRQKPASTAGPPRLRSMARRDPVLLERPTLTRPTDTHPRASHHTMATCHERFDARFPAGSEGLAVVLRPRRQGRRFGH